MIRWYSKLIAHWLFTPFMVCALLLCGSTSLYAALNATHENVWITWVFAIINLSWVVVYVFVLAWESERRGRALDTVGRIINTAENRALDKQFAATMTTISWSKDIP